jgi:hypothetical protein
MNNTEIKTQNTEMEVPRERERERGKAYLQQPRLIPVVLKLKEVYGTWQDYLAHFPKTHRFTIGSKIDNLFLEAIEYTFLASYTHTTEKQALLSKGISKVDLTKLLLQLSWEIKALDNKKYSILSEKLAEVGKMLGGWKRQLLNKTPENVSQEKQ